MESCDTSNSCPPRDCQKKAPLVSRYSYLPHFGTCVRLFALWDTETLMPCDGTYRGTLSREKSGLKGGETR